jgi:P4 family phage/plasmid primase-like protien
MNNDKQDNIFSIVKNANIPIKEFIERHYGLEFRKNKCLCPFHQDTKPSLSIQSKDNYFHCFVCDTSGDVINFVEKFENLTPLQSAKRVCDLEKIEYIDNIEKLSDEDKKRIEEANQKRKEEFAIQKRKREEEQKKSEDTTRKNLSKKAPILAENFSKKIDSIKDELNDMFPNQTSNYYDWMDTYFGYDFEHDSFCFLIRDDQECYNIKHKYKFIYDQETRNLTNKRADGKWIGTYNAKQYPFPMEYFVNHEDNRVIITEGEKDSYNLLSLNINTLTLGGVTNSWDAYKEVLKDKIVFILFDNDKYGYINSLKRYNEIKDVAKDIFIVPFFHINSGYELKFDVTDFIIKEGIDSKAKFFDKISYSSYKVTNSLIDDYEEFLNDEDAKLSKYKAIQKYKEWEDIKYEFIKQDEDGNYINVVNCKGELDDEEIDQVLLDIRKIRSTQDFAKFKQAISLNDDTEKIFDRFLTIKQTLLTNYRQTHIVDMLSAFNKMAKKSGYTFAQHLQQLAVWTGTYYQVVEDDDIGKFLHRDWFYCAKIDYKKQTKKNVDELLSNIKSKAILLDSIKKRQDRRVINLLNGTLFVSKRGKITFKNLHDKKDACTNILKFNYDPTSKAPKWQKFLNRVLPSKDDQKCLMEYMGYCFLPAHAYETFLFLYGKSGANGKSVIMSTISNFFGSDNVSSLDLQQFCGHELEALSNKILNIGTEIDAKGLNNGQLAMLKKIVSPEDRVPIDPKHNKPYQLEPSQKPKCIFSGNNKPKNGLDDAVFRRMLLISFDSEIKDDEKVRDLSNRFTDEMSGILNMALAGLNRLISQGSFTKSEKMKESIEEYKDDVNPIRRYASENIIKDERSMIAKKFMYHHYLAWCEESNSRPKTERGFWSSIKDELRVDTKGVSTKVSHKLLPDNPRFVHGLLIKQDDIPSFKVNNESMKTELVNLSISSKSPLCME